MTDKWYTGCKIAIFTGCACLAVALTYYLMGH